MTPLLMKLICQVILFFVFALKMGIDLGNPDNLKKGYTYGAATIIYWVSIWYLFYQAGLFSEIL